MSRNTKIILIIVGCLAVICIGAGALSAFLLPRFAQRAFSTSPSDAHRIGTSIAQYTLPPGYSEQMGMDFLFEKIVMIGPTNRRGMFFMLLQVSTLNANRADMEQQMRQAFSQQFTQRAGQMQYIGQETATIRGEQVPLTIYETQSASGRLRQAVGGFSGKNGYVMVMAMGDSNEWNEDLMKTFFGSIQ